MLTGCMGNGSAVAVAVVVCFGVVGSSYSYFFED